MSQRIQIKIIDKIATCLTELPVVCGNSDYEVEFLFDKEWEKHNIKTGVFVVNGESIKQIFEGNVCKVPVIQNTLVAWVGVFAGTIDDGTLSTSTPAIVRCKPSITDGENVPAPPKDDVYNQLVKLCEDAVETAESVEERANKGEFNGKNGKDGKDGKDGDDYVLTETDKGEIANEAAKAIGNAMVDGHSLTPFGQKHFYVGNPVSTNPTADTYINPSKYTLRETAMNISNDAQDDRFFCVKSRTGLTGFDFYANYNANYIGLAFKLYGDFYYGTPVDAIYLDIGVKDNTDEFIRVYMSRGNECEVHIGQYSPPSERKDYFVTAHYSHNTDWSVVLDRKAIERYIGSTFDKMYIRGLFTVLTSAYETETCFGFKGDAFVKKYHSALNDMFPHVLHLK